MTEPASGRRDRAPTAGERLTVVGHLRRLASESLVYGVSSVASTLVAVVLVPVYTRVFEPDEYGVVSLVTSGFLLLSIFVVLALDNSAHRWFWDSDDVDDRKATVASWAWCQMATSLALASSVVVAAPWVATQIVGRADAAPAVRAAALSLPLMTLVTVTTNWFRMHRRAWATVAYAAGVAVLTALLAVVLVVGLRLGITGVFLAQALAYSLGTLVAVAILRDWVHPRHVRRERLRAMLRYAVPLIPAALAYWVVQLVDRFFVKHYASPAELGLYQVGYQLSGVVALGTGAFQQAWGPFAFSLQHREEARSVYADVLLLYLWAACLASTAVSIFSPEILDVFAGPAYEGASSVVGFLTFSYVMIGLTYVAAIGPSLARTTAPVGTGVSAAALLTIALNFLLTARLGKEGAALATLLAWSIVPVYVFWRSQRLHPIPYRFGRAVAILAFAGALTALGLRIRLDPLVAQVAAKLVVVALFVPALFVLGIVQPARLLARAAVPEGGEGSDADTSAPHRR